ncbi:hypothetical protein CMI45_00035 [Candidatus Pacearchaeota archaeon]|jgi:prefoldin alpha subunit|nr:hypothetical protein [Candidatus Pacearchaeota archaeon]|tara:strand:- start:591 stop:983 length:393 start_codon:yes stop_codon:yes gene_type:complete
MDTSGIIKASQLEARLKELQENLEFVDSQIIELEQFSGSIKAFGESVSKEKEIMASIGKGVHVPAEIKGSDLLVEVGAGIVLKKSPEQTLEVVNSQLARIKEARINLLSETDSTRSEFFSLVQELESVNK